MAGQVTGRSESQKILKTARAKFAAGKDHKTPAVLAMLQIEMMAVLIDTPTGGHRTLPVDLTYLGLGADAQSASVAPEACIGPCTTGAEKSENLR